MDRTREFIARAGSFDALVRALTTTAGAGAVHRERVERQVLDTFDWRLHNAGLRLEGECGARSDLLILRGRRGRQIAHQTVSDMPRFVVDVPPGTLRDLIAGAVEVRALLVQLVLEVDRVTVPVLDGNDKTIARITVENIRHGNAELMPRVVVTPVRGYDKPAGRVADRLIQSLDLEPADSSSALDEGYHLVGVVPGSYSSKLQVDLDEDEPARVAMARLFASLLETMDLNEEGVRHDTDTEFLHDFRVAIRRTRSLLVPARSCLGAEGIAPFEDEFRRLARTTSAVRDLDVFLLELDRLVAGIASEWRDHLDELAPLAIEERDRVRSGLLVALDRDWVDLRDRWGALLGGIVSGQTPPGGVDNVTAGPFARTNIAAAHQSLIRAGRRVTDESPAEDVHRVRKRAKVLRYQLEAFGSLLEPHELREVTAELRKLQDVLGAFQDHEVQVQIIRDFTEHLTERGEVDTDFLLALGAVRAHVRDEREAVRLRCAAAFRRFDTPDNRRRYRTLVTEPGDGTTGADVETTDEHGMETR